MSSREKGAELEEAVAVWLKEAHGCARTTRNAHGRGHATARPYDVDVHGEIYSPVWRFLSLVGFAAFAGAVATWAMTIVSPREVSSLNRAVERTVSGIAPALAGFGLLTVGFVAFVVAYVGKKKATSNVWVECKNRQTRVKRADIAKLHSSVDDVRTNDAAPWKPQRVMIVSGSGFDVDALAIANKHGIECYERTSVGIRRVN